MQKDLHNEDSKESKLDDNDSKIERLLADE